MSEPTEVVPVAEAVPAQTPVLPHYHVVVIPESGDPYDREFDKMRGDSGVLAFLASIASQRPFVRCYYGHRLHVTRPPLPALVGPDGARHPIPIYYQSGEVDPSGRLGLVDDSPDIGQGDFPQRRLDA